MIELRPVPKPQHKRRAPKMSVRNAFDKETRKKIIERDRGMCRECGAPGQHIHHVKPRSQGGRGVFTNGILLCFRCHERAHRDRKMMEFWQKVFRKVYGPDYYRDEWDKEWS